MRALRYVPARMRGVRKAETSDERGEWTVESADAWRKQKPRPSDERGKGEGHVGSVSELFFFQMAYKL
jgi:hypothetical protein